MEHVLTFEKLPEAVTMLTKEVSELKRMLIEQHERQPTNPPDQLYSIQQASDFLNLKVPTVYSKVSKNELPYMKRGNRLYFSQIDLLEYIKEGSQKSNDEIIEIVESHISTSKKAIYTPKNSKK
jgi:excisionase family DNA binding protein